MDTAVLGASTWAREAILRWMLALTARASDGHTLRPRLSVILVLPKEAKNIFQALH